MSETLTLSPPSTQTFPFPTHELERENISSGIEQPIKFTRRNVLDFLEDDPDLKEFVASSLIQEKEMAKLGQEFSTLELKQTKPKVSEQRTVSKKKILRKSKYEEEMEKYPKEQLQLFQSSVGVLQEEEIFNLLIPIRCYTCNKVLGRFQTKYENLLHIGKTPGQAMDILGITNTCCRMNVLSPSVIPVGAPLRIMKRDGTQIIADPEQNPDSPLNNVVSVSLREYRNLIAREKEQVDRNMEPMRIISSSIFNSSYRKQGRETELMDNFSIPTSGEYEHNPYDEQLMGLEGMEQYRIKSQAEMMEGVIDTNIPFGLDYQKDFIGSGVRIVKKPSKITEVSQVSTLVPVPQPPMQQQFQSSFQQPQQQFQQPQQQFQSSFQQPQQQFQPSQFQQPQQQFQSSFQQPQQQFQPQSQFQQPQQQFQPQSQFQQPQSQFQQPSQFQPQQPGFQQPQQQFQQPGFQQFQQPQQYQF
jgi:DNA-directed RNA polymerase subunit N (RpoN/RPB10)